MDAASRQPKKNKKTVSVLNLQSIWKPPGGNSCGCKKTSDVYGKTASWLDLCKQFPAQFIGLFTHVWVISLKMSNWFVNPRHTALKRCLIYYNIHAHIGQQFDWYKPMSKQFYSETRSSTSHLVFLFETTLTEVSEWDFRNQWMMFFFCCLWFLLP